MSATDGVAGLDGLIERKSALAPRAAAACSRGRLRELRCWQAARLAGTYADLGGDPGAAGAIDFFLSDLYGPHEALARDADLTRAWRLIKRALSPAMLEVLSMALELDVLSTELDLELAERLPPGPITAQAYAQAYRAVGRREARRRQIHLIVAIGNALARTVRNPIIALALRAAHAPAHLAGFGALQDFLERGFGAFRRLAQPARLLATIEQRELRLMETLLAGGTIPGQEPAADASVPA
jgi:hypothetical protein